MYYMAKILLFDFSRVLLHPKEIIFIDDTIENIYPAKEAGLQTISYTSNKQLIKELQNL